MSRDTADSSRRRLLATAALAPLLPALGALGGCASAPLSPIQAKETTDPAALALFNDCATAHGLNAWRRVKDLNVSYSGEWRPLIGRIQPELTDTRFRDSSQERLLPAEGLIAQTHIGPGGHKQVVRRMGQGSGTGDVQVWYNGRPTTDEPLRQASALVADGYRLFLLGPLALVDRPQVMKLAGLEQVGDYACERLMVRLVPGLGFSPVEQIVLCIDRRTRLMRRVRFTLEGLTSTRGAVAEVDVSDFQNFQGIEWPTRFQERLRKPIPHLPVHDWQLTGLDLNRGWSAADITGSQFAGVAKSAAKALPGSNPVLS
ncbi:hypothetical protein HZU83_19915 [Sphaerotilus montanus]|jgi:hypothetical protein|uniref:Uncharacterized protein n=1 Tax=Sphaerotilus montanus TaxID=522889 RepID=A0A7Y9U7K2_9BURK|nr:hypothetical protein [Sphaerotilus montanus]NYG33596.1 hypothetical protein [Sphaerotilus montanus]NZD58950.1 hypothetical protein [Sphaerotilus montanus]